MSQTALSKIRVLRVISRMNIGGPAVQISGLMRRLDPLQYDQMLLTGFCDQNESDYLETVATDVQATRIKHFGRKISLWGDFIALLHIVRIIREFNPDIIHTHTAKAGFLGRIASLISFRKSLRIHTYHGHLLFGYFGPVKKFLLIKAEKMLSWFTTELLAVGKSVREDLIAVGIGSERKFSLMPPGLEIGQLPEKKTSKFKLGLDENRFQCAYIGRVTKIKRPDRFLDVVAELKTRGLELDFFIAGEGELLDYCKQRIIEQALPVKLLGWQTNIEQVLAAADVVALTSDNEGTPLCLIQAGMAKLPVVSTNVGSVSEIVLEGVTGFLTSNSSREIADAIEMLVLNPKLREEMGSAGRKFTNENFGIDRLVFDHEKLYKSIFLNQAKF